MQKKYIAAAIKAYCDECNINMVNSKVRLNKIQQRLACATSEEINKLDGALALANNLSTNHTKHPILLQNRLLSVVSSNFVDYHANLAGNKIQWLSKLDDMEMNAMSTGMGFYGSFLCYAKKNERDIIRESWEHAKKLVSCGLLHASLADPDPIEANLGKTGFHTAKTLVSMYFGPGENARSTVLQNLKVIRDRMNGQMTFFQYFGPNLTNVAPYHEQDYMIPANTSVPQTQNDGDIARGSIGRPNICIPSPFFNGRTILGLPHAQLPDIGGKLVFTRGGAIVHELTHNALSTADETCTPNIVANLSARGKNNHFEDCYGTDICTALAVVDQNRALNNADNYRLFCEDAQYFMGNL